MARNWSQSHLISIIDDELKRIGGTISGPVRKPTLASYVGKTLRIPYFTTAGLTDFKILFTDLDEESGELLYKMQFKASGEFAQGNADDIEHNGYNGARSFWAFLPIGFSPYFYELIEESLHYYVFEITSTSGLKAKIGVRTFRPWDFGVSSQLCPPPYNWFNSHNANQFNFSIRFIESVPDGETWEIENVTSYVTLLGVAE